MALKMVYDITESCYSMFNNIVYHCGGSIDDDLICIRIRSLVYTIKWRCSNIAHTNNAHISQYYYQRSDNNAAKS